MGPDLENLQTKPRHLEPSAVPVCLHRAAVAARYSVPDCSICCAMCHLRDHHCPSHSIPPSPFLSFPPFCFVLFFSPPVLRLLLFCLFPQSSSFPQSLSFPPVFVFPFLSLALHRW